MLTPTESAENWVAIVRFLNAIQPSARVVLLCAPYGTVTDLPDRLQLTHGFFDEFTRLSTGLNVDVMAPFDLPGHLTRMPADRDHFDMSVYHAMAGHIYFSHIAKWPKAVYGRNPGAQAQARAPVEPSAPAAPKREAEPVQIAAAQDAAPSLGSYGRRGEPARLDWSPVSLLHVIAGFLNVDAAQLGEDSGVNETNGWDSINQLKLMMQVEQRFAITFAFDDVVKAGTVREIRTAMRHLGVAAADDPEVAPNLFAGFARRACAHPDAEYMLIVKGQQEFAITNRWVLSHAFGWARRLSHLPRGTVVAILLDHSEHLYSSFIGCVLGGLVPTMLPPLTVKQDPALFRQGLQVLFDRITPAAVLTTGRLAASTPRGTHEVILADDIEAPPWPEVEAAAGQTDRPALAGDLAFLQHSSGTTGHKKGVMLGHAQVLDHVRHYAASIELVEGDTVASWLPLYHDMGLITGFIMPTVAGCRIVCLDAIEWVANPTVLFDFIDKTRANYVWLPNFAFNHIVRSDRGERRWDLSSLKTIVNCSEPCRTASFDRFVQAYGGMGAERSKLSVSYAMAENVFAVTQTRPWRDDPAADAPPYLSSGRPLPNVAIEIRDEAGLPVADGTLGEIWLKSSCMFGGYFRLAELSAERLRDGWYLSRDLGYLQGGELVVIGRLDDLLIVNGKNLVAHEIEDDLSVELPGMAPGRVLLCGEFDEAAGSNRLVVLAEAASTEIERGALAAAIRRRVYSACGVVPALVEILPRGFLVKSTSGKLARKQSWDKWRESCEEAVAG